MRLLPCPFPVRIQNSLECHSTKVVRHAFNIFVKDQRILVLQVRHLVRRHSPLPRPILRIHQKISQATCVWRRPDDTRPLFIAEFRLPDVGLSKVDDDWRAAPVPQNDIPNANVIVQDAVLGLDSTESLRGLAGDPLCFLLRDVNNQV